MKKSTIKFTTPLTGDKVNSIVIKDDLYDTWSSVKLGVGNNIDPKGYSHDIQLWTDTDDTGKELLSCTIYELQVDDKGNFSCDMSEDHVCTIVECDNDKYEKIGDFYYLMEK